MLVFTSCKPWFSWHFTNYYCLHILYKNTCIYKTHFFIYLLCYWNKEKKLMKNSWYKTVLYISKLLWSLNNQRYKVICKSKTFLRWSVLSKRIDHLRNRLILFYISRWTLILKSFNKVRNSMFIIMEGQRVQYSIYVIMHFSLFFKCVICLM